MDIATGRNYLAFRADNQNLGKYYATGIDYDITGRYRTPYGQWTSQLNLSQMLREEAQLQENGPYYSAIGNFAELGTVTFRHRGTWRNSLKTGDFLNTLDHQLQVGLYRPGNHRRRARCRRQCHRPGRRARQCRFVQDLRLADRLDAEPQLVAHRAASST